MRCGRTGQVGRGGAAFALLGLLFAADANAQSLGSLVPEVITQHDRVVGARADVRAAQNRAREALGDWYPVLEPTATHGYENIENPHDTDTSLPFSEIDLSLTQLLWDFGATNAAVEKARLELVEARTNLSGAEEDLLQEAVEAYVNLYRASRVLEFARRSKDNIRKQTGLEEARVETGGGLSTDVLQAKRQLAGADAREIQSEGTLISARNRYFAIFDQHPQEERLQPVKLPVALLPISLEDAISRAEKGNNDLIFDRLAAAKARKDVHNTFGSEFFPKIEGIVERKWKNNVSGTVDLKKEFSAKVEMSIPINLGLTAVNTLRAAQLDVVSSVRTVADTRRRIVEETRNAWQELHTARATAASRQNQADIAAAFLELAREERKLGNRSLIDVLTGETELINAQSDAESANSDVVIAAYKLLNIVGDLKVSAFSGQPTLPAGAQGPAIRTKPATAPKTPQIPDMEKETDPLAPYTPSPEMVPDGQLTGEAIKPFAEFFQGVRGVFEDQFEKSQTIKPEDRRSKGR